jgi:opacity protein-like surface antigen
MRLTYACLAICLAGALSATVPASAGDLSNGAAGGIRDYSAGGVPVPMPTSIYEENFKWYARGDLGIGFKNSGTISTGTWPIDVKQPANWSEQSILSFGFGRYISPSVRVEGTVDYRTPRNIASGVRATPQVVITRAVAGTSAFNIYDGIRAEDVSYQNTTFLMSGYYDFNARGQIRPYVGAGVGMAVHQLHRRGGTQYECVDGAINTFNGVGVPPAVTSGCSETNGLVLKYSDYSHVHGIGFGLAAQVSAGVSYAISPRTHWDTGYRLLWQSGRLGVSSTDGLNQLHIADRFEHEIRTGVRYDLW